MHTFEWAVSGLGTLITAIIGNFQMKLTRHSRRLNEHEVALGKIPGEMRVAILESEERTSEKFVKVHESIADLKETVLLKCGREG